MNTNSFKYFALHKPYGILSQFTDRMNRKTLSIIYNFPKDVYPVGRLDMDSEGLLLLTNDKSLTDYLLNPLNKHEREYYVQVEGIPKEAEMQRLIEGVIIEKKKTLPAKVNLIKEPDFPQRIPAIRERKNIHVSWLSLILIEGRHRQVRKMTARIGTPTLRLIRIRIKNIFLNGLKSGEFRELTKDEIKILKHT